jgi:hypothetical protein
MFLAKIASSIQITSASNGTGLSYELTARAGGHTTKVANYQIVILQKSSNNVQIGIRLQHGPDGRRFLDHSIPIAANTPVGAGVVLLNGDADQTRIIGEWMLPTLTVQSSGTTEEWAVVDVYEMRKPF